MILIKAEFTVCYTRGSFDFTFEDVLMFRMPKETPYLDIVAEVDEAIRNKFGENCKILGYVNIKAVALGGKAAEL